DQQQTSQQPAAGQATGAAAAAQPAADRAASAMPAQSDVSQVLSQTVQAALSGKGIEQQLCQADRQRIGDLSQQSPQISQATDPLKQAFKDKFQKDLDLSQSATDVFTATFFRIGGAGDEARQAAARIG